jgi:hypothetical protein
MLLDQELLRTTLLALQRDRERVHDQHYDLERFKSQIISCVLENRPMLMFTPGNNWTDPQNPEHPPRFVCHRDHKLWQEFLVWLESEHMEIQYHGWNFTVIAK